MASLKVDLSGIKNLHSKFVSPELEDAIYRVVEHKAIAAIIAQAIADNFAKEGPGWKPLDPKTIRYSVSKAMRKKLAKVTNAELAEYESLLRKKSRSSFDTKKLSALAVKMRKKTPTTNRKILQKTGLMKRTMTTPGFSGSEGANIYKVEGTNLIWGTTVPYAIYHVEGKGVPKRNPLDIKEQWMRQIFEFMATEIEKIIKGHMVK